MKTDYMTSAARAKEKGWVDKHGRLYVALPAAEIAQMIDRTPATIRNAFNALEKMGLVERRLTSHKAPNIELLIGQSSTEGERKRRARQANRAALNPGGQMSAICLPEIEIKRELEIEKERELKGGQPAPAAFGRYENVFLSDTELTELQTDFPTVWQKYIERLSEYMASTGRTYKNHAATIRRWIADDRCKAAPAVRDRDYSVKEGDTV